MTTLDHHLASLRHALDRLSGVEEPLEAAARSIALSFVGGGKLLAAGNGGSAAEAQHLTGELLGRLAPDRERGALPAVALHADTSTLTAVGNDYGYDQIFARQVEALGQPGDVLVVLSTSGGSANLVAAAEAANARGMVTVGLLGPVPRRLHELCTHVLAVPSESIQTIQEGHLVLLHALVEVVEDAMREVEAGERGVIRTAAPSATLGNRHQPWPAGGPLGSRRRNRFAGDRSGPTAAFEDRIGIMQGRLVPSTNGQLDSSPGGRWREEFWSAASVGLNHIELVADRQLDKANPLWCMNGRDEITRLIELTGVDTPSLCFNEMLDVPLDQHVERCAVRLGDALRGLRIRMLVLPLLEASDLAAMGTAPAARAVRSLVDLVADDGLRVVVEMATPAEESLRFLEAVGSPDVGLCYDVGNAAFFGFDPVKELEMLGPSVWHVHAKDKTAGGENVRFGTGRVEFTCVFDELARQQFNGLVTMEATRGDEPVSTAAAHRSFLLAAAEGGHGAGADDPGANDDRSAGDG